ncbi:MAG: hypothetical protein ACK41E_07635 [Deinococcales bacterium]
MWFLFVVLFFSSHVFAQNQANTVQQSRVGIFEFEFDPEDGAMIARVSDSSGTKPLEVEVVQLHLIGESGSSLRFALTRAQDNVFQGTVKLAEGEWNMVVNIQTTNQELEGQYTLGVSKAVTDGRIALTPPNPEVGRLSWLIGLLIGVPLGLGLLVGSFAVLQRLLRGAQGKPQNS